MISYCANDEQKLKNLVPIRIVEAKLRDIRATNSKFCGAGAAVQR
jgi:hypothetical protein